MCLHGPGQLHAGLWRQEWGQAGLHFWGGGCPLFPVGGGGSEWGQGGQWGKLKGDGVGVWGMLWTYKPHSSPSLRDTPPPGAETPPPPLQDRDPPPEAKTPPFAIIGTPP